MRQLRTLTSSRRARRVGWWTTKEYGLPRLQNAGLCQAEGAGVDRSSVLATGSCLPATSHYGTRLYLL